MNVNVRFPRYVVASALSLAADWLCLLVLTQVARVEPGAAAAVAYMIGGALNYVLSRRFVFGSATTAGRRLREVVLFAATCALGTVSTGSIVHELAPFIGPFLAKLVAMLMSFVLLYWCRRLVVFDSSAPAGSARSPLIR